MKKLYYLLLLSLFTSFILMSNDQENKNKVLAQQLSTINTQFQKWKKELEGYKKWALENDGVLSAEEQAEIDRRQKDMDAILARVAQIVKAKGLLAFMGLPTKEETKATVETKEEAPMTTEIESKEGAPTSTNNETVEVEYAMGKKGGPNPEVTVTVQDVGEKEYVADLVGWCASLKVDLGNLKAAKGTAKVSLKGKNNILDRFNSAVPLFKELKEVFDYKTFDAETLGDLCDIMLDAITKYNSPELATIHYRKYNKIYREYKLTNTTITPNADEIVKLFDAAIDETDPVHPTQIEIKRKTDTIKAALTKWHTEVGAALGDSYNRSAMTKTTKMSSVVLREELKAVFEGEKLPIQKIGELIINAFQYETEPFAFDVSSKITQLIAKCDDNKALLLLFVNEDLLTPKFPPASKIGNAFENAVLGKGGDANAAQNFKKTIDEWKNQAAQLLKVIPNDSTSLMEVAYMPVIIRNVNELQNKAFDSFWMVMEAIWDGKTQMSALEAKERTNEVIQNIVAERIYEEWAADLSRNLPNIQKIAFYIEEYKVDTSFQHYLNQWNDWRKQNFVEEVGIDPKANYYLHPIEMKLRASFNERLYDRSLAGFVPRKWAALTATETGVVKGDKLQKIWNEFIAVAPTSSDFYAGSNAEEAYGYITTYTQLLPNLNDLRKIIQYGKETKQPIQNQSVPGKAMLVFEFQFDWIQLGLLLLNRSFQTVMAYDFQKMGNTLIIKNITANNTAWVGLEIGNGPKFKITPPEIKAKSVINGKEVATEVTQTIDIEFTINKFGDSGRQVSGSASYVVGGEAGTSDTASVGGGIYTAQLQMTSKWEDGKISVEFTSKGEFPGPGLSLPRLKIAKGSTTLGKHFFEGV